MAAPTASAAASAFARRNQDVMGPAAAEWTHDQTMAWMGLLGTHRGLTRGFGKAVETRTGLSPTALGLIGRLHQEDSGTLRVSALSEGIGLSLSRTSRVIDALEARGLVVRAACPQDARAINVVLTEGGRAIIRDAQEASNGWVQANFFAHLSDDEVAVLATVFERFTFGQAASPCGGAAADPCEAAGASGEASPCTEAVADACGPAAGAC